MDLTNQTNLIDQARAEIAVEDNKTVICEAKRLLRENTDLQEKIDRNNDRLTKIEAGELTARNVGLSFDGSVVYTVGKSVGTN